MIAGKPFLRNKPVLNCLQYSTARLVAVSAVFKLAITGCVNDLGNSFLKPVCRVS